MKTADRGSTRSGPGRPNAPQPGPTQHDARSHGPARHGAARPPGRRDTRRPTTARPLSPARRAARPQDWFAQQLMLVLSGQRPVHSLLGHVGEHAYERLGHLATLVPLRPVAGNRATPALHGVGVCRPGHGVIEAFARIAAGGRTRALAFRLERSPEGRWLCKAVELDVSP